MIKRLIFDLDNTLIMWKEKYKEAIKKTIDFYHLDIDYLKMDEVIESYEKYYNQYTKENMISLINQAFGVHLKEDFIDTWLDNLSSMADIEEGLIDTLEYLSKKYELVILTNWFKESQENRIKYIHIDYYFKEIYGGDDFIKPQAISYKTAMGGKEVDECIMIGDNYLIDIKGALQIGMKAIMVTDKNIDSSDFKVIQNIKELKEIL